MDLTKSLCCHRLCFTNAASCPHCGIVDDVIDDLGSREEIEHINRILERGTSADGQLRVWRETGEIKAVVNHLIQQTMEQVPGGVIPTALAAAS